MDLSHAGRESPAELKVAASLHGQALETPCE
jgi:hypothetical protein